MSQSRRRVEPKVQCLSCNVTVGEKIGMAAHMRHNPYCLEISMSILAGREQENHTFPRHDLENTEQKEEEKDVYADHDFGDNEEFHNVGDNDEFTEWSDHIKVGLEEDLDQGNEEWKEQAEQAADPLGEDKGGSPVNPTFGDWFAGITAEFDDNEDIDEENEDQEEQDPGPPDEDDGEFAGCPADSDTVIKDLTEKYDNYIQSGLGRGPIPDELKSQIELLVILKKARAPFYLFREVWKWAQNATTNHVKFAGAGTRYSVIKELHSRYDLGSTKPITTKVTLPESGKIVDITTHDFTSQLYSMLSDPVLMREENLLLYDGDTPFGLPPATAKRDSPMRDINDGSVFRKAHKVHVTVHGRDLLVPIILFIDKTHVDEKGRLTLEPVSFTLGIFKKEVRNHPFAWRPLGYATTPDTKTPFQKLCDYHFVLQHIFASLLIAQKAEGIAWTLPYKGQNHHVVMKIPILCILGDTEGHDKLCGRYANRTLVKALCRYCDCTMEQTSDTKSIEEANYTITKAGFVARLIAAGGEANLEKLKAISYHPLEMNAFTALTFCDPVRGINGATVAEVLHVVQHGLFLYAIESLLGQRRVLKTKRRPKKSKVTAPADENTGRAGDDSTELVYDDPDEVVEVELLDDFQQLIPVAELGRNYVFSQRVKDEFDELAKRYGRSLCHQSDREFNRSYFPTGISSSGKKFGHEERCVILLILIILCSKQGIPFDKDMKLRTPLFVLVFTLLLLLEHFLRLPAFLKSDFLSLRDFMPLFLARYKDAVARTTGKGMNFIKFHLPLHMADDLLRFGPAYSTDSSAGESMHKGFKDDAKRTQKTTSTFDQQTAKNYADSHAINRAGRELHPPAQGAFCGNICMAEGSDCTSNGSHYVVNGDGMFNVPKKSSPPVGHRPQAAGWVNESLMHRVTKLIQDNILPSLPDGSKSLFLKTQATVAGHTLYRADPGSGRHDWTNIKWEGGHGIVPGRIMIFFDIPSHASFPIVVGDSSITASGIYAIIESVEQNLYSRPPASSQHENYLAHGSCQILYWSELKLTSIPSSRIGRGAPASRVPALYTVPVTSSTFDSPVIAVPYDLDDTEEIGWMFVEPQHKWLGIFRDTMKDFIATDVHNRATDAANEAIDVASRVADAAIRRKRKSR